MSHPALRLPPTCVGRSCRRPRAKQNALKASTSCGAALRLPPTSLSGGSGPDPNQGLQRSQFSAHVPVLPCMNRHVCTAASCRRYYCFTMPFVIHVIVGAFSLTVFVSMAMIFQLAEMELNPLSKNFLAMGHSM